MNRINYAELSDKELNSLVQIKGTQYNKNSRYGDISKNTWKKLYQEGHSCKEIADMYGAVTSTVRMVVDPEYRVKVSNSRVEYNRNYYDTHDVVTRPGYRQELIARKRDLVTKSLSHLVTI